jgi:hypothetical protein
MFCWRKMIEKFLLEMPQLTLGHFQRKRGKNDNFDLCHGNFFLENMLVKDSKL